MKPLPDAQREVLAAVGLQDPVRRAVWDALGTVLAEDVTAPHDVPPFATVQGDRARLVAVNLIGLQRNGFDGEQRALVKRVFRLAFWPRIKS